MARDIKLYAELKGYIDILVAAGFEERDAIIEAAVQYLYDAYDSRLLRTHAANLTDSALTVHAIEQRRWNYETDCDRLDEAFAELDRSGIVARHNFTCCQTCGHAEIGHEIDDTLEYRPVRGYVFYHQQDSEHVAKNNKLYLAYGSVDGSEDDSVAIAHEVARMLQKHGLSVQWNGKLHKRIEVQVVWRRRRVSELWECAL